MKAAPFYWDLENPVIWSESVGFTLMISGNSMLFGIGLRL